MCITVNTAVLSKTKILSVPVGNGNHFLAYSNSVRNTSGKPNAMILAIPGKTKQELFYDTTEYKKFMDEIIKKSDLVEDYFGIRSRGITKGLRSFDSFKIGMYHVGLAESFTGALEFIKSQPEPVEITEDLSKFFQQRYKGWSFAVCLFDTNQTIESQPIAFEYTPFEPDTLYFPTMDAHDGEAPDLNESVKVDHTFIYEHTGKTKQTLYQEFVDLTKSSVPDFLKQRRFRHIEAGGFAPNGDTFLNINTIAATPFENDPAFERG